MKQLSKYCFVCNSPVYLYSNYFDDRFGYPRRFNINKCFKCGHFQLDHDFNQKKLNAIYRNNYPMIKFDINKFRPVNVHKGIIALITKTMSNAYAYVQPKTKVLDIGCGHGESVAYYKTIDCDAEGIDPNPNILTVKKKEKLKLRRGMFHLNKYKRNTYDYVVMDQVIEHSLDPLKLIKDVKLLLKKNGKIIMTTPNFRSMVIGVFGRTSFMWHVPYHLHFFNPKSIGILLRKAGYKNIKIKTITNNEWLFYEICHSFFKKQLGKKSPFLYPDYKRTIIDNLKILLAFIIHKSGLTFVLSTIFDIFSKGGNLVVIAEK